MYNKQKNRGLAFINMSSEEEAQTAIKNLDKSVSIYIIFYMHYLNLLSFCFFLVTSLPTITVLKNNFYACL